IRQMLAAEIRIVHDIAISGIDVLRSLDQRLRGKLHGVDEHLQAVFPMRNQHARLQMIDAARQVECLADYCRRGRELEEDCPLLEGEGTTMDTWSKFSTVSAPPVRCAASRSCATQRALHPPTIPNAARLPGRRFRAGFPLPAERSRRFSGCDRRRANPRVRGC